MDSLARRPDARRCLEEEEEDWQQQQQSSCSSIGCCCCCCILILCSAAFRRRLLLPFLQASLACSCFEEASLCWCCCWASWLEDEVSLLMRICEGFSRVLSDDEGILLASPAASVFAVFESRGF